MAKLYQDNFDLFVNNECRVDLNRMGYYWLKDCKVDTNSEGKQKVTLPLPSEFLTRSSSASTTESS